MHMYFQPFDQLVFYDTVLHRVCEHDGAKYHQLILPIALWAQIMELLYNEQGYQVVEHTLALI